MHIHHTIGRMIIKDMEPYQVVDKGFHDRMNTIEERYTIPSRKFLAKQIIHDIHCNVGDSWTKMLQVAGNVSFTTDSWTTENIIHSYLGITVHWLLADFSHELFVLNCMLFNDKHMAHCNDTQFEQALDQWQIKKSRCHLIVRDNAANMAKCFKELELPSTSCFAHSLQLVINEGIISQRYVTNIFATCCKMVA